MSGRSFVVGAWASMVDADDRRFHEMRYLMLVCVDPDVTDADRATAPDIDDWLDDVADVRVMGNELQALRTARTVRVRDGQTLVTDGPYTESKEWIAGFDILEVPDLEAAIKVAAAHPMAYGGRIEVRPFAEVEATASQRPQDKEPR
jgi:hypothetical protein